MALVVVALIVALLLAALLEPLARQLHRGVPSWAAAVLATLALVGAIGGTGFLLEHRVQEQFSNLAAS